ncbi:MAG: ATP-dependent helicase [Actinomycetota bacterium]|nr:ATP-dependent helicase [Actinomycetota bacterium]
MPDTHTAAAPRPAKEILTALNPQQRAAASHEGGPLLVVAGAGTGKTATLAHRVAFLIARGVDPGRILLLTFTRRASAEMLRRVDALLKPPGLLGEPTETARRTATSGANVWGGTFHAAASRLLRLHGRDIGLEPDFTILDRGDGEDLMHVCRTELGLGTAGKRFPQKSTCFDIYSRCVNAREPLAHVLATRFPWCRDAEEDLGRLFAAYTDRKESQQVLDYDDLLVFWHGLLASEAGTRVRDRFDHVLVDEYQDTNVLQAEILSLLRPDGTGVTAVGDDAQSIYSFRAATVRNILDFEQRFPGATVLTLERNYRSTAPILDATNALIAEATERRDKTLHTDRDGGTRPVLVSCRDEVEQTDYVIDAILEHRERGTLLREQAVLFRAGHHSAALEIELSRRNVPFIKYGGLRFIEMAHVKDLTAFLRLAENPRDETAGLRALQLLPGIGPRTAAGLMHSLAGTGCDFETWVGWQAPEAARGAWPGFVTLMRGLSSSEPGDLASQVHAVRVFYAPLLEMRYDNADARLRDIEQIESMASKYPDRQRLLTELALDPPAYTQELAGPPLLDEDFLILSTMHSAKGLEFDVVYVIHAADGNIPSDMVTGSPEEIEEERRLMYVACTRARDDLYVTYPLRYYTQPFGRADPHGYAQRSRFVTDGVASLFRSVQAQPDAGEPETAAGAAGRVTTADIRAGLGSMWM